MKTKSLVFLLLLLSYGGISIGQQQLDSGSGTNYRIMLAGASFAYSGNGWFEMGCKKLNASPVNKGAGWGGSIVTLANAMAENTFYNEQELEEIDAFVIMHVHDRDVYASERLREDYSDYDFPLNKEAYAEAFDYVIKKYLTDCYLQKSNPTSKYYGSTHGKPALIVLCTHWHDSREVYNSSIRQLAQKWGLPLVEFDKFIGFSKHQLHPVTKEQSSLIFSLDSQTINGIKYGWHPLRGEGSYIQQRMGAVFADLMDKVLPIR